MRGDVLIVSNVTHLSVAVRPTHASIVLYAQLYLDVEHVNYLLTKLLFEPILCDFDIGQFLRGSVSFDC